MILLSASQIKTYRECVRKWALQKIAGLKTPSTPSQELGKDVDDNQLQPYLRDGRPFDFTRESGYIASSGMAWLPKPKWRGLEVQKHFIIPSPSKLGFGYQGYLDVWLPFGGQPGFDNELPVVVDFKTTKSIRRWALKEDALREDVQAQLYATWALLDRKVKEVNLSWLYLQTEGSRLALPTQVTVTSRDVAQRLAGIEADAKKMFQILKDAPEQEKQEFALSLPPSPHACDGYGGCPFRHLCNLGPEDFIESIEKTGETTMSGTIDLFSKLRKKKIQEDAVTVAETATATEAPTVEEPALGINPPEKDLPPAPPVGSVEAKPKRGRPSKKAPEMVETKSGPELVAEMEANAKPSKSFDAAWAELRPAVEKFLKAVT